MTLSSAPDLTAPGASENDTDVTDATDAKAEVETPVEHEVEDKELLESLNVDDETEDEKKLKEGADAQVEDETEENLENLPHHRPSFKEVKLAFPEFFKKFPDLREAFFREQKFTEQFSTVEEAVEAKQRSEYYVDMEGKLLEGSAEPLLKSIKEADGAAFSKLSKNLLSNLYSVDQTAFFEATTPFVNNLIRAMHDHGVKNGNKNVEYAALYMSQFVNGKLEIPEAEHNEPARPDPEKEKFDKERNDFFNERYQTAYQDVVVRLDRIIDKEISSNLDPDNVFTPHMRGLLVKEIKEDLHKRLGADPRHTGTLGNLWKKYSRAGFKSDEIKTQILRAVLSRAKPLIPQIRNKHRSEALDTKQNNDDQRVSKVKEKELPSSGQSARVSGRIPSNPKEIDWSKTTDDDILNGKFTPRRR